MPNPDPHGYYAALNVNPKAEQAEIVLAYKYVRASHRQGKKIAHAGKIEEAWSALANPQRRAEYDREAARTLGLLRDRNGNSRLNSGSLLAVVSILLVAMVFVFFGAELKAPFTQFERGDVLQWRTTHRPVGVVMAHEKSHAFPDGKNQQAYLIKSPSGGEIWLPASDLHVNGVRK